MNVSDKIFIKNMVCPRCVSAVSRLLDQSDIGYQKITLGEVQLSRPLSGKKQESLSRDLQKIGFELLESKESKTISRIKTLIINQIHHSDKTLKVNYSDFVANELHYRLQRA